jgi:hypothetical protein
VVEYLSLRFTRAGKEATMDSTHPELEESRA